MALGLGVWRLSFSCCDKVATELGSGFSAVGSSSTKCRLQTLESLLGIQRVPFKLYLLIFLPIVVGVPGSSFLSGTGII